MKEQFTPGYIVGYIQGKNNCFSFETVCHKNTSLEQAEILRDQQAAAPDMYEALKDCKAFIENGGIQWPHEVKTYEKVLSALSKANPQPKTSAI